MGASGINRRGTNGMQGSPGAIAYETHLLGMDEENISDSEVELFVEENRTQHVTGPPSRWPVVVSVVSVFTILGALVAIADYFQNEPAPYDRACLESFQVSRHLGLDSPYPTPEKTKSIYSKCNLVHLSYVTRGGPKNPTEEAIQDLDRLENWIHANMASTPDDVSWLTTWSNSYTEEEAGQLSQAGEAQFRSMGTRMKETYGKQLPIKEGDAIRVRSTQDVRSAASAEAFLTGFLGNFWSHFTQIESLEKGDDAVLKYSDRCHVFTDLNSKVAAESGRIENLHLERIARKISRNLDASTNMKVEDVSAVLSGCMLDLADYGRDDRFCALVSAEDWLYLEALREESSVYVKANATYPFISRPLWDDILTSLENCVEGEDCQKMDLRFGTESTLLPFLLRVGIQPDECYGKTSAFSPTSGNVALELYDNCSPAGEGAVDDLTHIVKIRIHEEYVDDIPICDFKDYCTLTELRKFVRETLVTDTPWEEQCESVISKISNFM